ncbi:hypothetical protein BFJ68_g7363 [Fusarium oxysporum]|uniref:Uncharacterized protein n=1 Tax=Fusarium oxysporum TaxID=5507 RepID=A0A420R7K1_FUSOX|nr:hypothetical protein BFJ68_g7363 [Fusarium oxysporum]
MVKQDELARFYRTQLYMDIELGLHNLLIKKRDALSPPHSSPAQHYYAAFSRPPNCCWDEDSDRYTEEGNDCETPYPILGKDMKFKICQRDHPDGEGCADRVCFIPNASARKYMLDFMVKRSWKTPSLDRLEPVAYCLVRKYCSNIPSKDIETFSRIVRMLFEDLRYPDPRNWDPEVHGVLNWKGKPIQTCVDDFMSEIHGVKWKRDMREYF